MNKVLFTIVCITSIFISCVKETPRSALIEFNIGDKLYSYPGYAYRYRDFVGDESKGYDWHIYNLGQSALYIQAYDSTFIKTIFAWPAFEALFTVELANGKSKTYQATSGEFRITGQEMGDAVGDFHFKVKNVANPLDSLMITQGYYRIWLEQNDRYFLK
jgi:hypothetical protein